MDVFVHADGEAAELAKRLQSAQSPVMPLALVTNRGVQVWPQSIPETFCTDHWRCRFEATEPVTNRDIVNLLSSLQTFGVDFIKTENLYEFDGKRGYSLAQGQ